MYFVNERSCTLTFPAPAPPPMWAAPDCDMPQLHDRMSISSLCLSSPDSPLIPSILMNMSTAMDRLLFLSLHVNSRQPFLSASAPYFPPLADGSLDTRRRDTVKPSSW